MTATMSHSKMFEAAETAGADETAKPHKLATKLAKRREKREKSKKAKKDRLEEEAAEFEERLRKQDAWFAAYHEERRAEHEKDPTDPRNVAWKKRQDKEERLAGSRRARVQEGSKDAAIFFISVIGKLCHASFIFPRR